jgi:hypothetical protein
MKKYKFLLKPLFFVFNLLFATWLVLAIERIEPSDFGKHKSLFEPAVRPRTVSGADKPYLIKLFTEYKKGLIDSSTLNKKLDEFLLPSGQASVKSYKAK